MSADTSILDKIIQSQQLHEANLFQPNEILSNLFKHLSGKERDILNRRFGLLGKSYETLEQIGQFYQITRERIRQIESATIRKLKELDEFAELIEPAQRHASHLLENHGGLMEEEHFLDELLNYAERNEGSRQSCLFLLNHLLDEKIEPILSDKELKPGWKLKIVQLEAARNVLNDLTSLIDGHGELLNSQSLLDKFTKQPAYREHLPQLAGVHLTDQEIAEETINEELEKILHSLLRMSRMIDKNILGEWGLRRWTTVAPKRMSDKVYLVLKKTGKPLHFTEITKLVNESNFDQKTAYPATVHNELILDQRFVLVGRGIYALSEWGYTPGTVLDIIIEILKQSPDGLSRDEIVKKVLDQRIVRKSTIYLALTNKAKIKKLPDGRFQVA